VGLHDDRRDVRVGVRSLDPVDELRGGHGATEDQVLGLRSKRGEHADLLLG
jgi:hypothetical protein